MRLFRNSQDGGHTLSLAGRCCLINNVISSSLVHTMMVYRWPKSLLHRIEVAIRSYLWMGDINKKGSLMLIGNAIVLHCLGIRSIRLANASFTCKLTWDFLTTSDKQASFLRDRFFHTDGRPRNTNKAFSIRSRIHEHVERINDGSF